KGKSSPGCKSRLRRPRLEKLEPRCTPSVTAHIDTHYGVLFIEFAGPGNAATLDHSGSNTLVTGGTQVWTFADSTFSATWAFLGGSSDSLDVERTVPNKPVTAWVGDGRDTISFSQGAHNLDNVQANVWIRRDYSEPPLTNPYTLHLYDQASTATNSYMIG